LVVVICFTQGCYDCREVPLAPNTGQGDSNVYNGFGGGALDLSEGFWHELENPGTPEAVLTVRLPQAERWDDYRTSWEGHNAEYICRVEGVGPLEPELEEDEGWTTFLFPRGENDSGEDADTDRVIDAIAAGFNPPEAVRAWESRDQANLNLVYPPGAQVDPTITEGFVPFCSISQYRLLVFLCFFWSLARTGTIKTWVAL
jgi:hypothetical protein